MHGRDELIAKARKLSAAASPGPWGIAGGYIKGADTYPVCEPWPPTDRNGRFIAKSRTLLPALADLAESEGRRADEAEAVIDLLRRWQRIRRLYDEAVEAIPKPMNYDELARQFGAVDAELLAVSLKGQQP